MILIAPAIRREEFISPSKNMNLTVVKLNLLEQLLDGVFKTWMKTKKESFT
jgi:hypothetical protein